MKNWTICLATPTAADPAPSMTTFWSLMGTPLVLTALMTPPRMTAPVPWMSSLNIVYLPWYLSNDGKGFLKSSN